MTAYVAVVVIGYLVYLLVVVMLDAYYLVPIERLTESGTAAGASGPGLPTSLSNIPVDTYRMVFYHSAVVQGVGSGILTGQLAHGDLLSGLKYAIGLLGLAWVAFHLI
jgi:flagellar protein FlaJ